MTKEFAWRTGRSCVFKNFVHLVFVTKYRRGVFNAAILARLGDIFEQTCEQMGAELIEYGGEGDYVHLLVSCPPKLALANLVGKLKGKSSYLFRQEFWPQIQRSKRSSGAITYGRQVIAWCLVAERHSESLSSMLPTSGLPLTLRR
jgi:putative transposase